MKYKLKGKNIIKSDFEAEYNTQDFTNTLKNVEQKITELTAQQRVYVAKRDNVSRNHPQVLKVDEEIRNAIWLYQENFVADIQAEKIIKQLKKDYKSIKNEMEEITKQTGYEFE